MKLPPLPFQAHPVRRLPRIRPDELSSYAVNEPVVLTECMEDWKLYQEVRARGTYEGKLAVVGSLLGQQPVTYHRLPAQQRGQFHFKSGDTERLTFGQSTKVTDVPFDVPAGQMLQCLNGKSDDFVYMQAHFFERGTPLFDSLSPNVLPFLGKDEVWPTIWVGSSGQVVNLHYDDFLTFICMVEGVKRVTLLSPELLRYVYHAPFDRMIGSAQVSLVRLLEIDHARYPLFEHALREAQVVELQPGEVLLVPPMWWHHVESFGLNIMINNRVFMAPIEQIEELYVNLSEAARLFVPATPEQRAQALALYRKTVFVQGGGTASTEGVQEEPAFTRHRLKTQQFAAQLPPFLLQHLARYYEYFILQAHGDPHPTLPGALTAMVERNAGKPTFFQRD